MAKPPWARLTKPMRPMVTERPTDTMNSTMPAATPPRSMLATSTPKITSALRGRRSPQLIGAPRPAGPQPRDGLQRAAHSIGAPRPAGPQPRDGLQRAAHSIGAPRPAGPQPRDGLQRAAHLGAHGP